MKIAAILLPVVCILSCAQQTGLQSEQIPSYELWYDQPAGNWNEALPIGNGRLGAMVFGGAGLERIQFNEETLWQGEPRSYAHEGAIDYLKKIQDLLFEGKQKEAEDLAMEHFMSDPLRQMAYQPFGDLYISFEGHENYMDYRRSLSLNDAITDVSYRVGDTRFEREIFASNPDEVIVIKIKTDQPNALSFSVWMDAVHEGKRVSTGLDTQELDVKVSDGVTREGFRYKSVLFGKASLRMETDGEVSAGEDRLSVSGSSYANIYLTAATNYKQYDDVSNDPALIARDIFDRLENKPYNEIKATHISDHQSLFNRFDLDLGKNEKTKLPTDKRIEQFDDEKGDPNLIALYIQFGRYLMIASSREGTRPANLQGIWNDQLTPPWESKYTVNINTEMNYWLSEVANLSETHEPLFQMLEEVAATGAVVAEKHYGSRGWILHHNTDIWRGAAPINHSNHGIFLGGSGWLAHHFWERYLYTMDENFLRNRAYPVMKEAALFYYDALIEEPNTGWLVSSPSNSPEIGGLVFGPSMDHQIIRSLFKACIEASAILGIDEEFAGQLRNKLSRIAPDQIGQFGQLQEWVEDKDDTASRHRHVSHLWGMHPGKEINWDESPELMEAAMKSLEFRGDDGTGWSLAWKINFRARFLDGNRAYELIKMIFRPVPTKEINYMGGGGSYPNLFDAHPPFQIDGNFGAAAGIIEMIMQSHMDRIDILPALPDALDSGSISGARARGGFELSFAWDDANLSSLEVLSLAGRSCKIRYKERLITFETEKGKTYRFNGDLEQI